MHAPVQARAFRNSALQGRSRHVCARQLLPRHRGALAESTVLLIHTPSLGAQCAARRSCDGHTGRQSGVRPQENMEPDTAQHTLAQSALVAAWPRLHCSGSMETHRSNKKPGNAGLFVVLDHVRNARRTQVNKVCGYSGLRSRASNSFNPASGVISPCRTARTALEIGSSMPCCSA